VTEARNPQFKRTSPCACGCALVGIPRKNGHIRGCVCPPCRGGRNRRNGMTAQRNFQRAAGIKEAAWKGANGNEESWRDHLVWEHKRDGVNAKPVVGAYRRMVAQIEANRAIGDVRHPACGVTYAGMQLVIVSAATWESLIVPALDAMEDT